jgi:hypothetical protein
MFIFEPPDFEFAYTTMAGSYNFDRRHVQILRDFVVQFPIVLFIEVCKRDKYYLILYKEFVVTKTFRLKDNR